MVEQGVVYGRRFEKHGDFGASPEHILSGMLFEIEWETIGGLQKGGDLSEYSCLAGYPTMWIQVG
jgi:hypothetical protein